MSINSTICYIEIVLQMSLKSTVLFNDFCVSTSIVTFASNETGNPNAPNNNGKTPIRVSKNEEIWIILRSFNESKKMQCHIRKNSNIFETGIKYSCSDHASPYSFMYAHMYKEWKVFRVRKLPRWFRQDFTSKRLGVWVSVFNWCYVTVQYICTYLLCTTSLLTSADF